MATSYHQPVVLSILKSSKFGCHQQVTGGPFLAAEELTKSQGCHRTAGSLLSSSDVDFNPLHIENTCKYHRIVRRPNFWIDQVHSNLTPGFVWYLLYEEKRTTIGTHISEIPHTVATMIMKSPSFLTASHVHFDRWQIFARILQDHMVFSPSIWPKRPGKIFGYRSVPP